MSVSISGVRRCSEWRKAAPMLWPGDLLLLSPTHLALAAAVTVLAGFVKGAVGFAMPMVMISGFSAFLAPDLALAALILSALVSNVIQALRDGVRQAGDAVLQHRRFLLVGAVMLILSAQLVTLLDTRWLLALIGGPIVLFGLSQLAGWRPRLAPGRRRPVELGLGGVAGFVGGLSGVWGPPTVMYLTALDTPKAEAMRTQGVIYGLGSVLLLIAHLRSGVLSAQTAPLSAVLVVPALLGLWLGSRAHTRMDQARFRRITLVVLIVAGLNLLRRALLG